jgi:hypothetical protein
MPTLNEQVTNVVNNLSDPDFTNEDFSLAVRYLNSEFGEEEVRKAFALQMFKTGIGLLKRTDEVFNELN